MKADDDVFKFSPGEYRLTLIVGHAGISNSIHAKLGSIHIAYPEPTAEEVMKRDKKQHKEFTLSQDAFKLAPEIVHHFRPDPITPPVMLSSLFAVLCVALPWLLLITSWTSLGVNFSGLGSIHDQVTYGMGFLVSLIGSVVVMYGFWTRWTLLPTIGYLIFVGIAAGITGNKALSAIAKSRVRMMKKE